MPKLKPGQAAMAHDNGKANAKRDVMAEEDDLEDHDGNQDEDNHTADPSVTKIDDDDGENDNDDDDDPITATYPVFLNPSLPLGRRLLVLQHPNRTDEAPRAPPTELRLKSRAGMVEVDLPIDHAASYGRDKGLRWGRALNASMAAKNGGSHGLAGGFGFGAVQQRGAPKKRPGEAEEDDMLDWNEAMRQNKVLTTQTLGGQYPHANEVNYMVGVFQGKDLHLTPVSSLIHLRPQLHHLDATTQLERQAAAGSKDGGPGAGASSTAGPVARAIHMTIKTTPDGDAVALETMADRLRLVQTEPWRKMRYTDENDEAAWDVYNESLFLRPPTDEAAAPTPAGEGVDPPPAVDLEGRVPQFGTRWGDKQFLEAVSGIKKPEPEPVVPALVLKPDPEAVTANKTEVEAPRRPRVPARGGAASGAAPRRGGKTSRASTSRATIDLD